METELKSWGGVSEFKGTVSSFHGDLPANGPEPSTALAFGNLRSYGDVCLNDNHLMLDMKNMDHLVQFDIENGLLDIQAGATFDVILDFLVPKGWFLPVVPGTKQITIGGAVANDIHGKNHHQSGSIGKFIKKIELWRSDKGYLTCTPKKNINLFKATIGGLGLTGVMTKVLIQCIPIKSAFIDVENLSFDNLEQFMEINKQSLDFSYTVAWIDALNLKGKNKSKIRGIFMRGNNHSGDKPLRSHKNKGIKIPFYLPEFILNESVMKWFNSFYFNRNSKRKGIIINHYDPFFFPLDSLLDWNKIYGKRGFFQFQCVIGFSQAIKAFEKIFITLQKNKQYSYLGVLKAFGKKKSPGILSFPKEGLTLTLDFPNLGSITRSTIDQLHNIVMEFGGRVYPAKDQLMNATQFKKFYPNWESFAKYVDPKFSSFLWRRVSEGKK